MFGMPGIRPMMPSTAAATPSAFGWPNNCLPSSPPMSCSRVTRVTMIATATDNMQSGDLRDEAVTDGQQRVGLGRLAHRQVVHHRADQQAADDIDDHDEDAGDRVAADELAGAVHGTVEIRFRAHFGAARAGLVLRDEAGIEIGVDGHLLAGHRVQRESRGHFRHAARTLRHHDEIDDGEDDEDDGADGVVAADHELAEGRDHLAGRVRTLVAVHEHDAGRGDIERQAQDRHQQQHGREDREIERPLDVEHRHDDDERQRDVEREQHVEHDRRQRQDHHREDRDEAQRDADADAQQRARRSGVGRGFSHN